MVSKTLGEKHTVLRKEVELIAQMYFVALKHIKAAELLNDADEETDEYRKYVCKVRNAYHSLDSLEQSIINNEFFYQQYPFWWRTIYKRSTFYRLRRKAMSKFKEAFENAY